MLALILAHLVAALCAPMLVRALGSKAFLPLALLVSCAPASALKVEQVVGGGMLYTVASVDLRRDDLRLHWLNPANGQPVAVTFAKINSPSGQAIFVGTAGPLGEVIRLTLDQNGTFAYRQSQPLFHKDGSLLQDAIEGAYFKFRRRLRDFFEVNRHWVVVAALHSLAEDGVIPAQTVADAIAKYGIDTDRPAPWTV